MDTFQADDDQMKMIHKKSSQLSLKSLIQKSYTKTSVILLCSQQKQACYVCSNSLCTNKAYLCKDQNCLCYKDHNVCLLVEPKRLLGMIQKKLINAQQITSSINRIVDRCIDWLSQWRDKMQLNLKYYGLSNQQKKFIQSIHDKQYSNIQGKNVFTVFNNINKSTEAVQVEKAVKLIQKQWQKQQQSFKNIFENLQQIVCPTFLMQQQRKIRSLIIKQSSQIKTLKGFFKKKIKKMNLLYRASQHAFEVSKFFQKCSKIPNTLVIVQTVNNKKVGGYTPCQWQIKPSQTNIQDPSKQSFIFSLTNGDKFQLIQADKAIQFYDINCGPRFGGASGASDLTIKNKANQNSQSYSLFNNCYRNQKYKQSDNQSYKMFNGGQSNFFKVKQWEVFEIKFL